MKTFSTGIVTCRLDNETELRLFCKYEAGHNQNSYQDPPDTGDEAYQWRFVPLHEVSERLGLI